MNAAKTEVTGAVSRATTTDRFAKLDRFDKMWNRMLELRWAAENELRLQRRHAMLKRGYVYDFLKLYLEAERRFHNELLEMVRSTGQTIGEWMEEFLGPLREMGENLPQIIEAVRDGCSRRDFQKQHSAATTAAKRKPRDMPALPDIPPDPTPEMTVEETMERLRAIAKAHKCKFEKLQEAFLDMQKEFGRLKHDLATIVKQNQKLIATAQGITDELITDHSS